MHKKVVLHTFAFSHFAWSDLIWKNQGQQAQRHLPIRKTSYLTASINPLDKRISLPGAHRDETNLSRPPTTLNDTTHPYPPTNQAKQKFLVHNRRALWKQASSDSVFFIPLRRGTTPILITDISLDSIVARWKRNRGGASIVVWSAGESHFIDCLLVYCIF